MTTRRSRNFPVSQLKKEYSKAKYVKIKQFVSPAIAASWELMHRELPLHEVCVGEDHDINWLEHYFVEPAAALNGLAVDKNFISLICEISGLPSIDERKTQVWINRYRPGDYVPPHTDTSGDTQFLLCLQELPVSRLGGDLYIKKKTIRLKAGDAVLFQANRVLHGTSRIVSGQVETSGYSRVTCVIRFYSNT
jgi:hypothetical protein